MTKTTRGLVSLATCTPQTTYVIFHRIMLASRACGKMHAHWLTCDLSCACECLCLCARDHHFFLSFIFCGRADNILPHSCDPISHLPSPILPSTDHTRIPFLACQVNDQLSSPVSDKVFRALDRFHRFIVRPS